MAFERFRALLRQTREGTKGPLSSGGQFQGTVVQLQTSTGKDSEETVVDNGTVFKDLLILRAAAEKLLKNDRYGCASLLKLVLARHGCPSQTIEGTALTETVASVCQRQRSFQPMSQETLDFFNEVFDNFLKLCGDSASKYWIGYIPDEDGEGDNTVASADDGIIAGAIGKEDFRDWGPSIGADALRSEIELNFVLPIVYKEVMEGENGILMYGPPGTGKTYLVKAIARLFSSKIQNDVTLYVSTGADLKGKYVGESEKLIRDRYQQLENAARKKGDGISLLFIDEVETLAGNRSNDSSGTTSSTVTSLLQAMQGIVAYDHVKTIVATNLPWSLDPAILRRFTTQVLVDLPTPEARTALVKSVIEARSIHKGPSDEIDKLAKTFSDRMGWSEQKIKDLNTKQIGQNKLSTYAIERNSTLEAIIVKEEEKNEKFQRFEKVALQPFGYTQADIVKIINRVFNLCHTRLISTITEKGTAFTKENLQKVDIKNLEEEAGGGESSKSSGDAEPESSGDEADTSQPYFGFVEKYGKLAIENTTSSLQIDDYINMFRYRYLGKNPL